MKKFLLYILTILLLLQPGCNLTNNAEHQRYSETIFDTFDTLVQFVAYAENEEEFKAHLAVFHERLRELHRLFDIYNNYEGVNNIKTINDNAGIAPVEVKQEIIDLILFSKEWYLRTGGPVNIAFGPVLEIWHFYREEADYDPGSAALPPMARLEEAALFTNIENIIVDAEQQTVFLTEPGMSLDVGAVAKGYALEIATAELKQRGLDSAIISAGGNINMIGEPHDDEHNRWRIGIQNPEANIFGGSEKLLDVIYLQDGSVDTSGNYQRYYIVEGEVYHHLIDPSTLMPANHYLSVTVIAASSDKADFLSTALFLLPYEKSRDLADSMADLEALWVMPDGEIRTTAGMDEKLGSSGISANSDRRNIGDQNH